jgi:hypothetical protein
VNGQIATLFEDALSCLASEHAAAYAAVRSALGPRRFDLAIDDEELMLDLGTPADASMISVATSVETLRALVDGECTSLDAILDGRLEIIASVDDLIAAAQAMTCFMQGALRCVSMGTLLERLAALREERG